MAHYSGVTDPTSFISQEAQHLLKGAGTMEIRLPPRPRSLPHPHGGKPLDGR